MIAGKCYLTRANMTNFKTKIKILGSGPTGATLALALSKIGSTVHLFDPISLTAISNKTQTYALTHSSRRFLEKVGLWDQIRSNSQSFNQLHILDCEANRRSILSTRDLSVHNRSESAIGWILDHKVLMNILFNEINKTPSIKISLGHKPDISKTKYDLVMIADGAYSPSRKQLGLKQFGMKYEQACLTARVLIRNSNSHTAYELFRHEGPLALLPIGNDICQVIWSSPIKKCQHRASLKPSEFLDQLAGVLPDGIEPDVLLDQPFTFPLGISISPYLYKDRYILIGESGHRYHPVAGQGLNVCWRDVDRIVQLIKKANNHDMDLNKISRNYSFSRMPDIICMGIITDSLIRLFSNRSPFLLLIRRLLIYFLRKFKIIRKLALRTMTDGPMTLLINCHNGKRLYK